MQEVLLYRGVFFVHRQLVSYVVVITFPLGEPCCVNIYVCFERSACTRRSKNTHSLRMGDAECMVWSWWLLLWLPESSRIPWRASDFEFTVVTHDRRPMLKPHRRESSLMFLSHDSISKANWVLLLYVRRARGPVTAAQGRGSSHTYRAFNSHTACRAKGATSSQLKNSP
jgi:hypothetical protein